MSHIAQALRAGATIVTPNNRLARDVVARFDAAQRADGARAWSAAHSVPWTQWLEQLWRTALAMHLQPAPPVVLGSTTTGALWHLIVARHGHDWLNSRGAARHAAAAWRTFHAWRDDREDLDDVAAGALHADPAVFAQWAARYQARLDALGAIDDAQLPDRLAASATRSWVEGVGAVVLLGFLSLVPQQRRLVNALRHAGVPIDEWPSSGNEAAIRRRSSFATPRDEMAAALGDARARVERDPQARVAIVVADLDERRGEVIALADEILCPEHALAIAPDAPRPYGISLGEPLSSIPIVTCALDLIALRCGPVEATIASSVIRSPFLPDAAARWRARAECERRWAEMGQRRIGWQDLLFALHPADPELHRSLVRVQPPSQATRLPREWARSWADWLASIGWPGTAGLTSGQWQARESWSSSLARFASLGTVTGALSAVAALDALRALLGETLFQPESAPAQIQILGILEAAGLAFDHAWLAGFDAERWPGPTSPGPLLPLRWQQARGVPRAHPDSVFEQATAVTSALLSLAPAITVSHAQTIDDAPALISPLFADCEPLDMARLPLPVRLNDIIGEVATERFIDPPAPPVIEGASVHGGAQLLESQSACPFQAYARHRLRASTWPECPEGLSATERGIVLHAVLKAFWDGVRDHATLIAFDEAELAARVDGAVRSGKTTIDARRWRVLAPAVAEAESSRLAVTLRAWIDEVERARPSFRVQSHEALVACEIEGIALRVRVDRIDEFAAGGLAIIDYKSGTATRPTRWVRDRPEGIQLAVYADVIGRTTAEPIRALAYAQVKAGDVAVVGLTESAALWPALEAVGSTRMSFADWPEVRTRLHSLVAQLARDVRSGVADVAPRDAATCRHCGLQPLCRIQALDDGANGGGAGDE